jgi:hypothetical protein
LAGVAGLYPISADLRAFSEEPNAASSEHPLNASFGPIWPEFLRLCYPKTMLFEPRR